MESPGCVHLEKLFKLERSATSPFFCFAVGSPLVERSPPTFVPVNWRGSNHRSAIGLRLQRRALRPTGPPFQRLPSRCGRVSLNYFVLATNKVERAVADVGKQMYFTCDDSERRTCRVYPPAGLSGTSSNERDPEFST